MVRSIQRITRLRERDGTGQNDWTTGCFSVLERSIRWDGVMMIVPSSIDLTLLFILR